MNDDDIMGDIRAYREAFAAAHGYDIRAMLATLQAKAAASGQPVVRLSPRPVQPIVPTTKPTVDSQQVQTERVA